MANAKRAVDALCTRPPRAARQARVRWRRRPVDRIVRWIGASGRKRLGSAQDVLAEPAAVSSQAPASNIVILTWAQTFGRAPQRGQ
jgi:hypothetical protein